MEKPIVLVIMDGVGKGDGGSGDAVAVAKTPVLDRLLANCPNTYLKAHGTAVGLPSDEDMGNSEVGHNALGCGQVYSQGAKLVGESIENGVLFASNTWKALAANAQDKAMHFIGLLSDGNVHSNIVCARCALFMHFISRTILHHFGASYNNFFENLQNTRKKPDRIGKKGIFCLGILKNY